ncbi:hypothetical protein JXA59_00045 [Patescibacteria group bacterium]|nr:hypothetical protein [Patescibacteria group bacterium]
MWRALWFVLVCGLVGCTGGQPSIVSPGTGRLVRWSEQKVDSPYKLVLLPGCVDTADPNGMNPREVEDYFDQLIKNLNLLGVELLNELTFDLVELWLGSYYPNQPIDKIARDVADAIANNRHFDNSCVAIVGHSEGGVVVWLIDQRHDVIAGGVLLGAPILSTPVAIKPIRDAAVTKVFPVAHSRLIPIFDQIALGTEQLTTSYPETGQPHSRLMFFAGAIKAPLATFWQRNLTLLDVLAGRGDTLLNGMRDNRQLAELGALIIANSDWQGNERLALVSDGFVTVPSATLDGVVANYCVWQGYDHWDMISGKGELALHRAILEWLIKVWGLRKIWVETDLPATPDIIELPNETNGALTWVRFAYIDADDRLTLTDDNWDRSYVVPILGVHGHPQFDDVGTSLVFDVDDNGACNIYVLSDGVIRQISFDGRSRCPAWSPNERWLTYQNSGDLLIHNLTRDERCVVVTGVELLAPPVWTASRLRGRLYFVNTANELRWTSPRQREGVATTLVQANCSQPFLAEGVVGGIVVISPGSIDQSQQITVVTGLLATHLSAEIRYDPEQWGIQQDGTEVVLTLDHHFNFVEAAYDSEYNHLYLVGEWNDVQGIYLLDVQAFLDCAKPNPGLSEFFLLICEGASQLAIKPSR